MLTWSAERLNVKSYGKSSHFALHTGCPPWCNLSDSAKILAPHTQLKSCIFCLKTLHVALHTAPPGAISASPPKSWHRTHLKSWISNWNPYILLSIPPHWSNFSYSSKIPAPHTFEILQFPIEIRTFEFHTALPPPLHGAVLAITPNPSTAHTWNSLFSNGNPYILLSILPSLSEI